MTHPPPDIDQLRVSFARADAMIASYHAAKARRRMITTYVCAFAVRFIVVLNIALILVAAFVWISPARAEPVAQPITIIDGDTVRLATGEVIRLYDIDAPETRPCTDSLTRSCARCPEEAMSGRWAAAALAAALAAGPVTLERCEPPRAPGAAPRCTDPYGRTLGRLMVAGRSVGDTLIAQGLATRWPERGLWCGRR